MNFTHYKFDRLSSGDVIEVTLQGSAANVRLMNNSNFQSYKNGRRHQYYGGLVKQSPFRLTVPSSGQWHVTVDMAGLRGQVRSAVRVLPSALPVAQEASLASIPSLVRRDEPDPNFPNEEIHREFDVFISHASEDKDDVVRPLANALKEKGLQVWYEEYELKIGDSLRRKIDSGLAKSKFGVVVLSKPFLSKGWTNYELDGLVTKSVTQEQVLLPIWHNISKQEVIDYSPSLADKLGRNTAMHTVEEIAEEIAEVIKTA
ncbi:molecular chaperone Tir [Vibrio parahaemolyticus]|uniref:DUF1883 domain-containing protein n=1 Tax=Vibrio parahaemolyticus TaxID=670 RepID=UPI0011201A1A|nr:DUF1883 domain-containing protein [Vibrio parahaemolyticus]TOH45105.1 molecular chaperone Tir [Vibrio parahaemolyticus]